ncbi:hypothetical protein CCACVL1_24831 [Corchorus capsularis]|uniref:Uncharacterized protein n=1 Tax=Corchorus capsularis TaxID=210143 RepID=A0A1R3GMU4_COCAP|nr:hypothetical protein CCACVL1_24831 [Corchorus capsularis]
MVPGEFHINTGQNNSTPHDS